MTFRLKIINSKFSVHFVGSLKMLLRGVIIFPLPIFKGYEVRWSQAANSCEIGLF